jgi:hypothetical protein
MTATAVAPPLSVAPFQGDDSALLDLIDQLHAASRDQPGASAELIVRRNELGMRLLESAPDSPAHPEPSNLPPADGRVAEVAAGEVTPGLLRAAILRDGALLVRGLVDRERAIEFAAAIDRAYAERDRHDEGHAHDALLYREFEPDARRGTDLARPWIRQGGGLLAADSPQLSFEMIDMFHAAGVPELVTGYLGEPGMITAQKTTLRKAEASVPGTWHQDGKFMGPVRAINLWLSLSRCGDVAPGLDIVPRRLEEYAQTITDEPPLHYLVSQEVAERLAGDRPIQRPIFEPGDALLFDELFLHQTASDPAMTEPRYAIENWFFGASGFPASYAPLTV